MKAILLGLLLPMQLTQVAALTRDADAGLLRPAVFESLLMAGSTESGSKVTLDAAGVETLTARRDGLSVTREMKAPETLIVRSTVKALPISSDLSIVTADLRELVGYVDSACSVAGGSLTYAPLGYGGRDAEVSRWINRLNDVKAWGEHRCGRSADELIFKVTLWPDSDAKATLFPPGFWWNVHVRVITKDHLAALNGAADAYKAVVDELRNSLSPGTEVAIPTGASELAFVGSHDQGSICALVLDVKGSLVQVQAQGRTLFVKMTSVFPRAQARSQESAQLTSPLFTLGSINREAPCLP